MKKLIKCMMTLTAFAAVAGSIYYFWKNKSEDKELSDDFDDFDDLDDFDEEEKMDNAEDIEEESGYVTLKIHKEEEAEEKAAVDTVAEAE